MDYELRKLIRDIRGGNIELLPRLADRYTMQGLQLCPCTECVCTVGITLDKAFCEECEYHWPHGYDCDCKICQIPTYRDGMQSFIELHANHTLFELEGDFEEGLYNALVDQAIEEFEQETGEELLFLGRQGRHVCVEDTLDNRGNYETLRKLALKLEQNVINSYNETPQ